MAQRENLSGYERANMAPGNMGAGRFEEQGRGQMGTGFNTRTTGESEGYCANPATTNLPKEFETHVNIIEKVPEMKTVTKTDYVKKLEEREEVRTVPRSRVVQEEKEVTHTVPRVKEVPRTREEIRHRVVEERVQVPYTEKIVEQVPVTKTETVPRVVREEVQERVRVPHVTEVPVQRQVQVPTGKYCEQEVDEYTHKGAPHMMGTTGTTGLQRTGSSSSSSSSSSDEEGAGGQSLGDKIKSKMPGGHKKSHRRTGEMAGATTGTGVAHMSGAGLTGTQTGTGYGTGMGGPVTGTGRTALSHDAGLGHTGMGTGHNVTGTGMTGTGLGHMTGAGTGVAPHTTGTTHPGPSPNLTGRPAPGEAGATAAATEHHEKKGFFKKIEEKLTGHH
ncbi:hypothetical protein KFL_002550070 [Klebsormidium nitens]|uniref:Uncharacterized protein n=1 Tax=Klebsormidium nitens TaxID=105231 RepID=A0A1Y1I4E1_KLENI|nr:hypothetical protein KFL_002550070 [Klebsormidium nitens]|eukprot:GAQ85800.1 hypothetical protein KFL_002550070 [Klebsormidium nitens]